MLCLPGARQLRKFKHCLLLSTLFLFLVFQCGIRAPLPRSTEIPAGARASSVGILVARGFEAQPWRGLRTREAQAGPADLTCTENSPGSRHRTNRSTDDKQLICFFCEPPPPRHGQTHKPAAHNYYTDVNALLILHCRESCCLHHALWVPPRAPTLHGLGRS